jgi:hypothetical protein
MSKLYFEPNYGDVSQNKDDEIYHPALDRFSFVALDEKQFR